MAERGGGKSANRPSIFFPRFVKIEHCVLCTVYCVLCTVYCVLCTVYCVLCTVYCVLCTVYCVLCTVYCVLCTVYCVLCTVYCVLCTVYCVLCTVYCVLCTVYCVLCTVYCVYSPPHHNAAQTDLIEGVMLASSHPTHHLHPHPHPLQTIHNTFAPSRPGVLSPPYPTFPPFFRFAFFFCRRP